VVADEATRRGTGDATERWWGVLARSRYLPRFIRGRARLRWMARVDERRVAGRDPGDNRDTRIPVGEQVLVPVLWLTELYTPTTLDGLLSGLASLMARAGDQDCRRGDIVEWVKDARRQGGGSWRMLPNVWPAGTAPRSANWITDDLPVGITSVTWGIYTLTSTVTAVTVMFRVEERHAGELQRIVNKDASSRAVLLPGGSYTVSDVRSQKQQAADRWRENLRADAARWLARRLPGSFQDLAPGQLPTIELVLTERQYPWDEPIGHPAVAGWMQLLDLENLEGYWQCGAISWLRLRERQFHSWTRGQRHLYTLAGRRPDLLSVSRAAHSAAQRDALNEALHLLHLHIVPAANRLALTALLDELAEQLAATRDLAKQAAGKRSPRALAQIQQQLISTGLDSQIVADDIVRYARDERSWLYEVLDFTQVLPPALTEHLRPDRAAPARRTVRRPWKRRNRQTAAARRHRGRGSRPYAANPAPAPPAPSSLAELLRQGQIDQGTLVTQAEADLRDLINTSAQLTAAIENIRLQRRVLLLTIISVIVAVIAATAAVDALHISGGTPAPAPSIHPTVTRTQ
jgi:hypothetical protein